MDLASDIGLDVGTLKKGPWTSAEDSILISYVTKHGEGNWNSVQKHSGLFRCGKSCRLRWANHLRPNLKKGAFTPEEERIIVELHAKLGNKWARMAAQLPGRTDNEIKNYWNTRIKRRTRAGLPVYPADKGKSSPTQYSMERPDGRSFKSGKDIDCDYTPSYSQPGDHLQNIHVSNVGDHRLLRNWSSMSVHLPSPATNEVTTHLLNKTTGEQTDEVKNSCHSTNSGGNGLFSLAQLPDGKNLNFPADFNLIGKACDHGIMTRSVLTGFVNEPERDMMLHDRLIACGHLNILYNPPVSDTSLRLELPSSQSAESANSAGTQRSSITNPSPIVPSNHILSEVESYGSNASNFIEALMQEAHPVEGLEQVRVSMDLIEQLMVLTSGNVPPDVAALLLSPHKRRWGEDSDPTTPLGEWAFSDYSEEVSPMCHTGIWDEPQGSTMHSLPPAPQLIVPRVEDYVIEAPRGRIQQSCTDEEFLTLLDLANSDSVPEWYIPSEHYSLGVVPCVPPLDSVDAVSNPQIIAGLDNSTSSHIVGNHMWDLGTFGSSCTWNPASVGCFLGELPPVEYRSQSSFGDHNVDRRAAC